MSDLKSPWYDNPKGGPAMPDSADLSGDLAAIRGGADWVEGNKESGNSVSGLPALPYTMKVGEGATPSTMEPPTLKDRMPGTIDER